ncbi:MAG: rhomboid family intramembrane serine protease [Methanobacteriota archaeon]|nr:MAG: rhomboid family intramembrane serine protease [Euryarchaeota archaeon]
MKGERSHPVATYLLLAVNIGVYLYLASHSENPLVVDERWMMRLGFVKESFYSGAWWQPLTNMFTHFDLSHLGYNMVFLAFFGSKCEELFGGKKTLFFYLLFGALTTATSLIYPLGTISAGASGAIFGLLGADLIANRGVYPSGVWTSLLYGAVFFILAAATGFLAHLAGLVIGFIAGYIATRGWYAEEEEDETLNYADIIP